MNNSLIQRLIEAGTPADLIADIAMELAKGAAQSNAIEERRSKDRARQQRRRDKDNNQDASRVVTLGSVMSRDITNLPLPSSSPLVPPLSPAPLSPPLIPPTSSNPAEREARARKKINLDDLTVDHVRDWLAKKRVQGQYLQHNEERILEIFKDYCHANGKKYEDYVAAYRNSFEWDKCKPAIASGGKSQRTKEALVRGLTNPARY